MRVSFHKPDIGSEEVKVVSDVLRSGWLTAGPETKKFEEEFAEYVGSKYAVFLNSCTSALRLALRYKKEVKGLFNDNPGVLVPSVTFAATVSEVVLEGLIPRFCDVDEKTMCMQGEDEWISKEAVCAIPVHLAGHVADGYGDNTIFDSAHRIERDSHVPGTTTCYSFYPTKNMTTGEGGMLCTDDKEEYEWAIQARHHGRTKGVGSGYDVKFPSSKFNNTDIAAAIGRVQLKKLDYFNQSRNDLVDLYNKELGLDWGGNHLYVVRVKNREKFVKYLKQAGIDTSIHFEPIHKMTAYKEVFKNVSLPITERITQEIVSLPLYPQLKEEEVKYVCEKVKETGLLLP